MPKLSRAELLQLAGVVVLGAVLRFYALGAKSLWFDEAYSWWAATQPLSGMLSASVHLDPHPPLYYTLLHFWSAFSDSEWTLRALSALLSTLTLPVMYGLGRLLGQRHSLGLLAAFILAISPLHIQHAQSARMYALLTFTAACAIFCLLRLLEDPAGLPGKSPDRLAPLNFPSTTLSRGWWFALVVFTTLTMFGHNTAVFFPFALGLFFLCLFFQPAWHRWAAWGLLSLMATAILWLPWFPFFYQQSRLVADVFWMPAPTWPIFFDTCREFISAFSPGGPRTIPLVLIFLALALLGAWNLRHRRAMLGLLLLLLIVPIAGELLVSLRRPIFYTRTLIWATIPLYLLFAAGILQLRFRPLILAAVIALGLLQASSLRTYYRDYEEEAWRSAVAWLAPQLKSGDLILLHGCAMQLPFDYYLRQTPSGVTEHGLPSDAFALLQLEPKITPADYPHFTQLLAGHPRVWLISSHEGYTDPEHLVPAFLASRLDQKSLQPFNRITITNYTAR